MERHRSIQYQHSSFSRFKQRARQFGFAVFAGAAVLLASAAAPQETAGRSYARSVTTATGGIVATSQLLASQAGAEALARGGSAADAAIVANAVLAVLEPMMCGPGGDLFALHRTRAGELAGLNASGAAPAGLTIDKLRTLGLSGMPQTGIHTVTVPGAVAGWAALHQRYGRLPWKTLFEPAIRLARDGYAVPERIAEFWRVFTPMSCTDPECRRILLPRGEAPRFGEHYRNPELAVTFERIARGGASAFYRGPIARSILATSRRLGGTLQEGDLAGYEPEWVTPIAGRYRDWTIYELPPNSRGATVLQALNLLQQFPVPAGGPLSVEALHLRVEALRFAREDVELLTDPRTSEPPLARLVSQQHAAARAARFDAQHASCAAAPPQPRSDTTFIAVMDRDGNQISLIQSLATGDSGVVADGTGMLMQNRGLYFSFDPTHPNALAPGKRPSHTLMPAHMERGSQRIAFGFVGGPGQPAGQLQFISDIVDYGLNPQAALEQPQFAAAGNCTVRLEARFPVAVREALGALGHKVKVTPDYDDLMTLGQAVSLDTATGLRFGASSPRGDGAAIPEPPRWR